MFTNLTADPESEATQIIGGEEEGGGRGHDRTVLSIPAQLVQRVSHFRIFTGGQTRAHLEDEDS